MRKYVLTLLSFLLLIVSCSPEKGVGMYHINSDGSIILRTRGSAEGDVEVPDKVNGQSVLSLGNDAFADCVRLTAITIPDSVISIGARAFEECRKLTSLSIPESVTSIGLEAFSGCRSLEEIKLPERLKVLESNTFNGCESLETVTLGENLEEIGASAFEGCHSLKALTIPGSVVSIGKEAFHYCENLLSIEYASTKENWNRISLDSDWNREGTIKTIRCIDGDITL